MKTPARPARGAPLLFVACLAAPVLLALAAAPPSSDDSERPVAAYGENNPSCREWTDGCVICARKEDGATACSTPGIACLPTAVACTKDAK